LGIVAVEPVFSRLISFYLSFGVGIVMLAIGLLTRICALTLKQKNEVTAEERLMSGLKDI